MFDDYCVYVNNKPMMLVCNNTCYVKMWPPIKELMDNQETGYPYQGAKLDYILDIDNDELAKEVIRIVEPLVVVGKKVRP